MPARAARGRPLGSVQGPSSPLHAAPAPGPRSLLRARPPAPSPGTAALSVLAPPARALATREVSPKAAAPEPALVFGGGGGGEAAG